MQESYEYWKWSICNIMYIPGIKDKISQILYLNGIKYKFILEKSNYNECEYKDVIVFNNRYIEYINHNFV